MNSDLLPADSICDLPYSRDAFCADVLPHLPEPLANGLTAAQREAVWRLTRARRCINASYQGMGKTIQSVAMICVARALTPGPALVVMPAGLMDNWMEEFARWAPEVTVEKFTRPRMARATRSGVLLSSYGTAANLSAELRERAPFAIMVCDESQAIKSHVSKAFRQIGPLLKACERVVLLSGTPAKSRNIELFTQLHVLFPRAVPDYFAFARRYCDGHTDHFGHFNARGASNVEELSELLPRAMLRLRREDVMAEDERLAEVTRERLEIDPLAPIPEAYRQAERKLRDAVRAIDTDAGAGKRAERLVSALFRDTAEIKSSAVAEYVAALHPPAEKTVVFCAHHVVLDAIIEKLPADSYEVISGRVPLRERHPRLKRFLSDPTCHWIILTIGSCATGLNVTPVKRMIFAELDWCPSTLDQCECRIRRMGGAMELHYTYLICRGTLDASVFDKVQRKSRLLTNVVDGGRRYGDLEFGKKRRGGDMRDFAKPRKRPT